MDKRTGLSKDYRLTIKDGMSSVSVLIDEIIGMGGSCIVYKGKKQSAVNGKMIESSVIVKEFYPAGLEITRKDDGKLEITDEAAFSELKKHFGEGQSTHARFYEYNWNQVLPRMFIYGEANNTVYAVSDPGKGRTLSQIDFSTLTLSRIAMIMKSACSAIEMIHLKEKLYLDCKPDNFFYYFNNSDLEANVYLFDFDTIVALKDVRSGRNAFCSASAGWVPEEQELVESDFGGKGYRSPELIGYHTDAFSLGAIFFWLLTGHRPTNEEMDDILNRSFDWEKESHFCSGAEPEVIEAIQEIEGITLQRDPKIRKKTFGQNYSIKALQKQFETLSGLVMGDSVHFEPIHAVLKRIEKEMMDGLSEVKATITETKNDVNGARDSIEQTIKKYSLREMLFGTKRRTILSVTTLLALVVLIGVICAFSGRALDKVAPIVVHTEIEQNVDGQVLLKLSNANHQYEVGIENWRRLDYVRAERDILAAREDISDEVSQAEIEVAKINNSLGCLYLDMGRYKDAYDYLNSAYVTFRDKIGENGIEARAVRTSIARYFYNVGKLDEALAEIQYVLDNSDAQKEKAIMAGTNHLRAMIYDAQGKYEDALELYDQVLSLYGDILENGRLSEQLANYANDPNLTQSEKDYYTNCVKWIILTYDNIARVNIHKGDHNAAMNAAQTGIDMSLENVYIGKRNITTSRLYKDLAVAKGMAGNIKEALDDIDLAMRIQRNLFDFEDVFPGLVEVYDVYGDLLKAKGSVAKADQYYKDAVELAETSFGENHPETAMAYNYLGKHYLSLGDVGKAVDCQEKALEIRRNLLAEDHPDTAKMYYDAAMALRADGKRSESNENLQKAKKICDDWDVQGSLREAVENALAE